MKKLALAFLMITGSATLFALPGFNPMGPALLKQGCFFSCCTEQDCCEPVPDMIWCDLSNWRDKDLSKMLGYRIGYYGDFVFNRKVIGIMKIADLKGNIIIKNTQPAQQLSFTTNSAIMSISIMDRFEVFTTLGATQAHLQAPMLKVYPNGAPLSTMTEAWTKSDFSWSLGASAILWSCDCIAVGCNGHYFHATPTLDRSTLTSNRAGFIEFGVTDTPNNEWDWHEWQVSLGGSWWIHLSSIGDTDVVPYCNVKYASCRGRAQDMNPKMRFKLQQHIGYTVGATLVGGNRANITLEGRWLDEKALCVSAQLRF